MRHYTYIAAVWCFDSMERRYVRLSPVHRMGRNLDHAKDRARDMLPIPVVEGTRYTWSRDLSRAPHVAIERRETFRLPCGRLATTIVGRPVIVEPDVRIVPSVGELGWTP